MAQQLDIPAIAQAGADVAFATTVSLAQNIRIQDGAAEDYDPSTGTMNPGAWTVDYTADCRFYGKKLEDVDNGGGEAGGGTITQWTAKALLKVQGLPGAIPTTHAKATVDGEVWEVYEVNAPPAAAIIILSLRK